MEVLAIGLEAIAIRLEAIGSRLQAIARAFQERKKKETNEEGMATEHKCLPSFFTSSFFLPAFSLEKSDKSLVL